jgi:microsomal dipeptidase-like Zn-dependent dipeptidase
MKAHIFSLLITLLLPLAGQSAAALENISENPTSVKNNGNIYQFANKCYAIYQYENNTYLSKLDQAYVFSQNVSIASRFYLRPSALGVYLLFDQDRQYLISKSKQLSFIGKLESEMMLNMPEKDYLLTPAEWQIHATANESVFQFKNLKADAWLSPEGLNDDVSFAADITLKAKIDCARFPESETGTEGNISKVQHDDGDIWGFVDAHEHSTANHGFGGKIFHGASFHKLGIEHALADCEKHHGKEGSKDLMSITYRSGSGNISGKSFTKNLYDHLIKDTPDHRTDGYPSLSNWKATETSTHQSLYYKWIERAYLGGMRLMVEYMESTEVVCEVYKKLLPGKSESESCNEMDHVDHQIIKMKELQDYVDAQAGGPGKGWLRIVYSPGQAREIIRSGKLAVILGIEIENPFNCFVDEREGFQTCNPELVRERLNQYYDKGVRALFPSHKFVNAFSSGDGNTGILELGDYFNTGQWREYVACEDIPGNFLGPHGEGHQLSMFSELRNIPGMKMLNRFFSSDEDSAKQAFPIYDAAKAHCQSAGLSALGHVLIKAMMSLGMIIDLGHTPKAALNDIVPVLIENNYPAVNTHGGDQAVVKLISGLSTSGLPSTCRNEQGNSPLLDRFNEIATKTDPETGLPQRGLSYDFNGFAGYNKPRFGKLSRCETKQEDPLVYPFTSFGGDIVFEKLKTGDQVFDFNQDGLANIGLYPDLIEEARRSGASEQELTALFKTAEAYIRIWEKLQKWVRKRPDQILNF